MTKQAVRKGECEYSIGEIRADFPTLGDEYHAIIHLILYSYDLRSTTLTDRAYAGMLYATVGGRWMLVRECHIYICVDRSHQRCVLRSRYYCVTVK